ncbi:hypothetical protein R6Q57_012494 [Mikania cordata]
MFVMAHKELTRNRFGDLGSTVGNGITGVLRGCDSYLMICEGESFSERRSRLASSESETVVNVCCIYWMLVEIFDLACENSTRVQSLKLQSGQLVMLCICAQSNGEATSCGN